MPKTEKPFSGLPLKDQLVLCLCEILEEDDVELFNEAGKNHLFLSISIEGLRFHGTLENDSDPATHRLLIEVEKLTIKRAKARAGNAQCHSGS